MGTIMYLKAKFVGKPSGVHGALWLILLLAPLAVLAKPPSRLLPHFAADAGTHRLAQVAEVATRHDIVTMGSNYEVLRAAGIPDDKLSDGSVVSARVYCCGGPNEKGEAIWAYVPAGITPAVGDVIDVRMGDSKAAGSTLAVNTVWGIRATRDQVPGRCHWDPPDEYKWVRILYCDGIEQEGWRHEGGLYVKWMKPRSTASPEVAPPTTGPATPTPVPSPITAATPGPLELGVAAFASGDLARALDLWTSVAEDGDATAQMLLFTAYFTGAGVPRDDIQAQEWMNRCADHLSAIDFAKVRSVWQPRADAGDALAEFAVGWVHGAQGALDPKAYAEGLRWLGKAADGGNVRAEWAIGESYLDGTGHPQDFSEAHKWFQRAAERGNAEAAFDLGAMYEHGRGVRRSDEEAVRWYRVAAQGGEPQGAYNLANMLDQGRGVRRDRAEAVRWYRAAITAGHAGAANNLGTAYVTGQGVEQSVVEAYKWFSVAVSNPERLQNAIRVGANLDRAAGMLTPDQRRQVKLELARMFDEGRDVPRDALQAWVWYELATRGDGARSQPGTPEEIAAARRHLEIEQTLRPAALDRGRQRVRAWAHS